MKSVSGFIFLLYFLAISIYYRIDNSDGVILAGLLGILTFVYIIVDLLIDIKKKL